MKQLDFNESFFEKSQPSFGAFFLGQGNIFDAFQFAILIFMIKFWWLEPSFLSLEVLFYEQCGQWCPGAEELHDWDFKIRASLSEQLFGKSLIWNNLVQTEYIVSTEKYSQDQQNLTFCGGDTNSYIGPKWGITSTYKCYSFCYMDE